MRKSGLNSDEQYVPYPYTPFPAPPPFKNPNN